VPTAVCRCVLALSTRNERVHCDPPHTSAMTGVGEAAAALSFLKATVSVISTIDEAFKFSSECKRLRVSCNVLLLVIDKHQSFLKDDPTYPDLKETIDKCQAYLEECRTKKWLRNSVFEVTFHRRIGKYRKRLDQWIAAANFSVSVRDLLHFLF
jgi:hypothetical protein